MTLKGKQTAMVLSGGGAKGAYQIGMLRALEEAGLEKERLTLAGTSIGALNALMYAIGDTDSMRKLVWSMEDMKDEADVYASKLFPDDLLLANRIPVTVCAYCIEREQPEYFFLNELPPQEQRDMTVASASLPDLLPPVFYQGCSYLDGGKIPPQCSAQAAPADKIPLGALRGGQFELLIISYLKPEDQVDHSWFKGPVLEFRPSEPLEDEPGTGTRDYSPARLEKNERMGYEETKAALEGIYADMEQDRETEYR